MILSFLLAEKRKIEYSEKMNKNNTENPRSLFVWFLNGNPLRFFILLDDLPARLFARPDTLLLSEEMRKEDNPL